MYKTRSIHMCAAYSHNCIPNSNLQMINIWEHEATYSEAVA